MQMHILRETSAGRGCQGQAFNTHSHLKSLVSATLLSHHASLVGPLSCFSKCLSSLSAEMTLPLRTQRRWIASEPCVLFSQDKWLSSPCHSFFCPRTETSPHPHSHSLLTSLKVVLLLTMGLYCNSPSTERLCLCGLSLSYYQISV